MHDNIQTARLLLRRPGQDDLPALYAIHADPDTQRFNPSGPDTEDSARTKFEKWHAHWESHGFGYWAVCKADAPADPIGIGGIIHAVVGERPGLNLYFRFTPAAWGKGYAAEMARAAFGLAFDGLNANEVLAKTRPANLPSRTALERLGFAHIDMTHDVPGAPPSLIYRFTVQQYRKGNAA